MSKKSLSAVVVGILLLQSFPAFADHDWDRRGDHHPWDHRGGHGYVVRRLPPGYRSILWHGLNYLYDEGLFYQYTTAGYVIVEPPLGAVVPVLPAGYTTVMVRRTPYYYCNDTYYVNSPGGYVVTAPPAVPAPAPIVPQQISQPTQPSYKDTIDTYDIYIPNKDGSYTLVTLRKAEKGFVGPQGEFYPEHPTVEQLKTLYGKK